MRLKRLESVKVKRKTAFDWRAYLKRCDSLKLLWRSRTLVDTLVTTQDGFSDTVHWQVITALCPDLIEASQIILGLPEQENSHLTRHIKFPKKVNCSLLKQLIRCAYGEQILFLNKTDLDDLYSLSEEYNISHCINICLNYAKSLLDVHNCIQLHIQSLVHNHRGLRRASYSMIRSNFKLIIFVNQDFHLLRCKQLRNLLMDDFLKLNEDEEFGWLAIVRWICQRMLSSNLLITIYNRMISAPNSNWQITSSIDSLIVDHEKKSNLQLMKSFRSNGCSQSRTEDQLLELIKCLRFMRFRSINAFNIILSHVSVIESERLTSLVNHMKLRYIIRKKLPLDQDQLELLSPNKIRLRETTRSRQMLRDIVGFVKCRVEKQPILKELESQISIDDTGRAAKPRVPNSVAFLTGGWQDGKVCKSMLAYDFVCDKWFKLNVRLPEPRAFHASCSLPKTGQLFIFGGTNGEEILNSVIRFDPARDVSTSGPIGGKESEKSLNLSYRFHVMQPMRERRCHLTGVFHSDGRIYALGGHDGQQRLKSGEWFDPKSNQWNPIADMTIARSDAGACSHDNKIFIAGGQISDQFIQSSVEFYKSNEDTWTFVAPMIVPRMSFKLVSFKNHLLALGGSNGFMGGDEIGSVTRSVERYNPSLSSWSLCAPMNQKRCDFGVMSLEDNLIVVGGRGGRKRLKLSEALKVERLVSTNVQVQTQNEPGAIVQSPLAQTLNESNGGLNSRLIGFIGPNNRFFAMRGQSPIRSAMKWINKASLPTKRSGHSISVVAQLRNAKDFTYHGSIKQTKQQYQKPTVIKQKGRWHKFKIIKRRKLIKHLKIAAVITIIILIM